MKASCAECVHVAVCKDYINAVLGDVDESQMCGGDCEFYKDRSRFVELPFGTDIITDNVLFLIVDRYGRIGRKKIKIGLIKEVFVDHVTIGSRGVPFITVVDTITNTWFDSITAKDFGKTIFLTREEAEKAVKEREA